MGFSAHRFRAAFVQVSVVCALMLIADFWWDLLSGGYIDAARATRAASSETLSVRVAGLLQRDDTKGLKDFIESKIQEDAEILSIGVRRASGGVLAQTVAHEEHWHPVWPDRSDINNVRVPIYAGQEAWGNVEIAFRPAEPALLKWATQPRILALYVLLIASLGLSFFAWRG